MIYGKIFPTTRHSIHVREPVRKATLNGPKRYGFELFLVSVSSFVGFGYFWASKVTKNLNFVFLHCTFLSSPSDKFYPKDRKSTRLNSSHVKISYAVFC